MSKADLSDQARLDQFATKVRQHIAYAKRVSLTDFERALHADSIVVELVQHRFVKACEADVRDFLISQEGKPTSPRLSNRTARAIAQALVEPLRAAAHRHLATSVRRRARDPKWVEDAKAFEEAATEFVEKHIKGLLKAHFTQLEQNLIALGPLLANGWSRERG